MRPLTALLALALLAASLAGCADDPERYPDGVPTPSTTRSQTSGSVSRTATSGSATSTSTSGPGNLPPLANLTVEVEGTNATFTLEGSDPEGEAIVWDLDFGDGNTTNGTTLPAMVNHTYAPGNYTATLSVTDGQASTTSDALVGILGSGGSTVTFPVTFTEDVVAPCPSCTFNPVTNNCASWLSGQSGGDCSVFELLPDYAGHPFSASSVSTGAGADVGIEIFSGCDATTQPDSLLFDDDGSTPEEGVIPAGAACAVLWSFTDPAATLTLVIS